MSSEKPIGTDGTATTKERPAVEPRPAQPSEARLFFGSLLCVCAFATAGWMGSSLADSLGGMFPLSQAFLGVAWGVIGICVTAWCLLVFAERRSLRAGRPQKLATKVKYGLAKAVVSILPFAVCYAYLAWLGACPVPEVASQESVSIVAEHVRRQWHCILVMVFTLPTVFLYLGIQLLLPELPRGPESAMLRPPAQEPPK